MKKLFFAFLISIISFSGYSQKLHLGLKFSPHFSWLKTDNPTIMVNDGVGFAFSYGLMINYYFQDNYGLNFELCHSIIKFSSSYVDTSGNSIVSKWNQQYIEIPVNLKMQTNQIGNMVYYGKIGISPMINTAAKLNDINNQDNINFFNAMVIVGAGIHYSLGGNTFAIGGISFHNGLMRMNNKKDKIFDDVKIDPAAGLTNVILKPSYISVDMGILF